jgi:hypothetical protein
MSRADEIALGIAIVSCTSGVEQVGQQWCHSCGVGVFGTKQVMASPGCEPHRHGRIAPPPRRRDGNSGKIRLHRDRPDRRPAGAYALQLTTICVIETIDCDRMRHERRMSSQSALVHRVVHAGCGGRSLDR